jgi:hypothetical protein
MTEPKLSHAWDNSVPVPPVQQFGNAVLIRGSALRTTYFAVLAGIAKARSDGHNTAALVALQLAIREAIGHSDVCIPPEGIEWKSKHAAGSIGIAEAATILGVGERQMRRIARNEGLGHRRGRAWVLDRVAVLALAAERRNCEVAQPNMPPDDSYPDSWGFQRTASHGVEAAVDVFIAALSDAEFDALVARTRGGR